MSLALVAMILSVASLVLHYVAPRTKSTKDDKLLEYVDKAKDLVEGQSDSAKK